VIDPLWQTIEAYRQSFERMLRLQSIDKQPFRLVLTPTLLERLHRLERTMLKGLARLVQLQATTSIPVFLKPMVLPTLQPLAKRYGLSTSERKLGYILDHKPVDETGFELIESYYQALTLLAEKRMAPINEEWILTMLTTLHRTDNLPSFYREKELTNRPKSLVARIYEAAPFPQIESLMHDLIQFVNQSTLSSLLVAIIAFFYVDYIKPFDVYNDEMSILTFKNILTQLGWDTYAISIPLETLLDSTSLSSICQEVQKTKDLTYFITFLLPFLEQHAQEFLNQLTTLDIQEMRQEQNQRDDIVAQLEPVLTEPQPASVYEEIDANRYQTNLLETHPSMRRAEAYFYARHREKGKFYTIAQFKTLMGCAYETARTSMEHLVELGYYRKEQYKNKYVYTVKGD
jgi:Fic family protein